MRVLSCVPLAAFCIACAQAAAPPAAAPPAAPAPAPAPSPPVATPSVPTSATELLASHRAAFDECYAHAREARADLRGTRVEIAFTLDDAGKPMTVSLEYRHRWSEPAKECLRAAALALQFPPSLKGKQVGRIDFEPPP